MTKPALIKVQWYENLPATGIPVEIYLHVSSIISCRWMECDQSYTEVEMLGGRVYPVAERPWLIEKLIQGLGI